MNDTIATLTAEQKAVLFDSIFTSEYEVLIRIEIPTSTAQTLYASDEDWKKTEGISWPYEETVSRYILDNSVDTDPENILRALNIESILADLEAGRSHIVYYTVRDMDGTLKSKKAYFLHPEASVLMLTIQDFSTAFHNVSLKMDMLTHALSKAQAELSGKDAFLSLMDQHLRTPLYSIMGMTRIAEDKTSDHSFDDYLHKVSMSGSYMQETIDDMLTLRQIARREIILNPSILDLADFFANIERMIHPALYSKGLLFEMDTWSVSSLQIVADLHCLQQIVMKMLRSTAEYAVRGSRIKLHSRVLYETLESVKLEISVSCRGIVIDQERLSTLFRPYEYLDRHMNKDMGDLDIALIILRSCLLAMGSDQIITESAESKGTRISVTLSVPLAEGSIKSGHMSVTPDFTGKRILLVDDNKISRDVSEKLLINTGAEVIIATNGQEAVDLFESAGGNMDLILMDVLMPVMDGLESAKYIRAMSNKIPSAGLVPIIALTVNAFRKNFEESLEAGMNAHLVKPVEPAALYKVLVEYIK